MKFSAKEIKKALIDKGLIKPGEAPCNVSVQYLNTVVIPQLDAETRRVHRDYYRISLHPRGYVVCSVSDGHCAGDVMATPLLALRTSWPLWSKIV